MMEYDDPPRVSKRDKSYVAKIFACLAGLAITLLVLYCIFYRPDIYVEMMRHLENRETYAKEADAARKEAARLEKQVGELRAQLADSDSFAQSLHSNLQAAQEEQEALRSQVEEKDAEIQTLDARNRETESKLDAVSRERDAAVGKIDDFEGALTRRWHLSVGGYVSHPLSLADGLDPSVTGVIGIGRGHVQLLCGAGVDLDGGVSVSIGTIWTW